MKIILSRKGFDASYGGKPSPIFPDGTFFSLPIPEDQRAQHSICYRDIHLDQHNLGQLVQELTHNKIQPHQQAHLDPDLAPSSLIRSPNWRPIFGQGGMAESHLRRCGVSAGDLFLFFGWFRAVEQVGNRYRYVKGAPHLHVLFGWLQVESRLCIAPDAAVDHLPDWVRYHPHVLNRGHYTNNTLYLCQQDLMLPTGGINKPGAGLFRRFSSALQLTATTAPNRGLWELPRWFHPAGRLSALSYHRRRQRWQLSDTAVLLRTVGRGQEFVLETQHYPEALDWLAHLFEQAG